MKQSNAKLHPHVLPPHLASSLCFFHLLELLCLHAQSPFSKYKFTTTTVSFPVSSLFLCLSLQFPSSFYTPLCFFSHNNSSPHSFLPHRYTLCLCLFSSLISSGVKVWFGPFISKIYEHIVINIKKRNIVFIK